MTTVRMSSSRGVNTTGDTEAASGVDMSRVPTPGLPAVQSQHGDIVGRCPPRRHGPKMGGQLLRIAMLADRLADPVQGFPAAAVQVEQTVTETEQRVAMPQADPLLDPHRGGL